MVPPSGKLRYLCWIFRGLKLISSTRQASEPRRNRALAPSLGMHDGLRSLRMDQGRALVGPIAIS
jgi:hypothetical protein